MDATGIVLLLLLGFFVIFAPVITWRICADLRRRIEDLSKEVGRLRREIPSAEPAAPSAPRPLPPPPMAAPPPLPERKPGPPPAPEDGGEIDPAPPPSAPEPLTDYRLRPRPVPVPHEPGEFERAAREVLAKIWNWLIVGEEHRRPGVPMEYAVATNWLVRVGVLIMVVGVAFFLDYTTEKGWLGPMGQVSIAMLAGAGVMAAGIRLLGKKYHLLAQGFLGAGLATWYVAIYAGHIQYALFGASVTFLIMAVITACAAVMAVRFHSLLVAVLGILGGYGTPFMLPGAGNLTGLYLYLLVLGLGVLGVAHRRNWHLLNVLAFALTSALTILTVIQQGAGVDFAQVMPFAVAYFVLFSTVIFIYQVLHAQKTTVLELCFLLFNAAVFFGLSRHLVLLRFDREWLSVVTLALSAFYTAHLWIFLRRKGEDRGLAVGFAGLSAFFLVITFPLLLSDAWLTFSWSLLALTLLWISGKMRSRFLEMLSLGLYGLVALRFLTLDLPGNFSTPVPADLPTGGYLWGLLERLVLFGVPLAAIAGAMRLFRRPPAPAELRISGENDLSFETSVPAMLWTFGSLLFLMTLGYLQLELYRSAGVLAPALRPPLTTLGWIGACVVLLALFRKLEDQLLSSLTVLLSAVAIAKVLIFDLEIWGISPSRYLYLPPGGYSFADAGVRLLDFGLLLGFLLFAFRFFRSDRPEPRLRNLFGYTALALLLLYSTLEVNSLLSHFVPGLRAGGISVYWGVFALTLVTAGLFSRLRPLRICGLALFSLVAVKVFLSDLALLDPVYKIVAFILLGGVLIAGAYAYLRFEDRFQVREEDS